MTATDIAGGSQPALDGSGAATSGTTTTNGGGGSGSSNVAGVSSEDNGIDSSYHLKWIQWNSGKIPIVMQCRNGPCPLIATMNVLLLREKVKLPTMLEQITANQLLTYLGECIMESVPTDIQNDENALLNLEQHIHDAMEILPKLKTGLDVNIRFTGITDFEYTPECIIFDLLRIPLYHGWLSDPSLLDLQNAIGNQSYNQLVDNIIANKNSTDPEALAKVLIAEEFLERTASQLTLHGLNELKGKIKDNEIGILFRNNHFLTLFKREGEIYNLVTDHGYLTEDNIIWETLDNIEGAGRFFDSNFQLSEVTNRQVSEFNAIDQRQQQLESDFLIALSLKEEEESSQGGWQGGKTAIEEAKAATAPGESSQAPQNDFELARQLQALEDRIYEEMVRERQAREAQVADKNKQVVPIDHFNPPSQTTTDSSSSSETFSGQPGKPTPEAIDPNNEAEFPPLIATAPNLEPEIQTDEAGSGHLHPTPRDPSTSETDLNAPAAQSTSSLDSQGEPRAPTSRKLSTNRRLKSEKNLKESNCIVN